MSAGPFTRAFYQLSSENGGGVVACRVQPETLTFQVAPSGPATIPGRARMSGGKRRFGINARAITGVWVGAAPDGYDPNGTIRIPILNPADYATLSLGETITYLGNDLQIVGRTPEAVN